MPAEQGPVVLLGAVAVAALLGSATLPYEHRQQGEDAWAGVGAAGLAGGP